MLKRAYLYTANFHTEDDRGDPVLAVHSFIVPSRDRDTVFAAAQRVADHVSAPMFDTVTNTGTVLVEAAD